MNFSLPLVLDAVAKASVILAITAVVAASLRRASASARHFVWTLGLLSALAAPRIRIRPSLRVDARPAQRARCARLVDGAAAMGTAAASVLELVAFTFNCVASTFRWKSARRDSSA